jgi:hypothetical protein
LLAHRGQSRRRGGSTQLPTSPPAVGGVLWNDGGVVAILFGAPASYAMLWVLALPTSPPVPVGILWNAGGFLAISSYGTSAGTPAWVAAPKLFLARPDNYGMMALSLRFLDAAIAATAASALAIAAAWAQTLPSPTIGGLTVTPGGSGAVTTDGANVLVPSTSKTAYNIYSPVVSPGVYFFGNVRSVLDMESGTTNVATNAYDAYIWNDVPFGSGNGKAAGGLFIYRANVVAGAKIWGMNTTLNDSYDKTTGHSVASLEDHWEDDSYVYNAGTSVEGVAMGIGGPTAPAGANGFQLGQIGASPVAKWANGYICNAGACSVYGIAGALAASGTSISSQPVEFGIFDSTSAGHYVELYAAPFGTNSLLETTDNVLAKGIAFQQTPSGTDSAILPSNSVDTNRNLVLAGRGTGGVKTLGHTIAALPACVALNTGAFDYVTNGVASPTYYATVSTTGSTADPVFCNGSNWVYH